MSEEEKRHTSGIILELEQKINHLSRILTNVDTNFKLLLKAVNEINLKIDSIKIPAPQAVSFSSPVVQPVSQPVSQPVASVPVQNERKFVSGQESVALKVQHAKQAESQFEKLKAEAGIVDDIGDDLLAGVAKKIPKKQQQQQAKQQPEKVQITSQNQQSKITVTQQIIGADGKPVQLANIEIVDQFGSVINKTRTNPKGRWTSSLDIGQYEVRLQKTYVAEPNKKPIETRYQVLVNNPGDSVLELPSKDV